MGRQASGAVTVTDGETVSTHLLRGIYLGNVYYAYWKYALLISL